LLQTGHVSRLLPRKLGGVTPQAPGGFLFVSLELSLSPKCAFAVGIEYPLDAAVQGAHDTDAREHCRAA
jgi:hypothetical protein